MTFPAYQEKGSRGNRKYYRGYLKSKLERLTKKLTGLTRSTEVLQAKLYDDFLNGFDRVSEVYQETVDKAKEIEK